MKTESPSMVGLDHVCPPRFWVVQSCAPVAASNACTVWTALTTTLPCATATEPSTGFGRPTRHSTPPVAASSAYRDRPQVPTNTRPSTTAGVPVTLPSRFVRHLSDSEAALAVVGSAGSSLLRVL